MANLINWNPYDEFQKMQEDFNRLLRSSNFLPSGARGEGDGPPAVGWGPSVDLKETNDAIIVRAEIPGVNPDDIDLTITEDGLSIRGETRQETDADEQGYHRIERRYGSFQRTIPFPVSVKHDQATADYHNGVLEVKAPKAELSQEKATKLRVNPNGNSTGGSDRFH